MAATRCMGQAVRIGSSSVDTWAKQAESLPTECPHEDCTGPRNCRAIVQDYLRVQWKCMENVARIQGDIKAGRRKSELKPRGR